MMITVLGSRAVSGGDAPRAFRTRRASGLSRRFRSGAARSSAAETRLLRDRFLVAVATARRGVLKQTAESLLLDNISNAM